MEISVLLFDDAELLDWAGPTQVFQSASRYAPVTLNIRYYGYGSERISSGGLRYYCNGLWEHAYEGKDHIVLLPGGTGVQRLFTDKTKRIVTGFFEAGAKLASVCTGSLLLAYSGLLSGKNATTHHENFDELARLAPDCHIQRDVRYTGRSPVYTAAGISAGIDLALALVAWQWSLDVAHRTAAFIEYPTDGIQQYEF